MGYYIQTGNNHGKADYLIKNCGAEEVHKTPEWQDDKGIVCVVNNGGFEAAAYAYAPHELEAFKYDDGRERRWLLMDKTEAEQLSGFKR